MPSTQIPDCSFCEVLASIESEEDDMPSTLAPACSPCGLRFASRPLLELHIREDHVPRNRPAEPDHDDSSGVKASQPSAGGPSRRQNQASRLPRTTNEVIAMTVTRRPRRRRPGWAMTAPRRAIRALRYVNEELVRASEAMIRSARAPQTRPRPAAPAGKDGRPAPSRNALTGSPDPSAGPFFP